MYDKIIFIVYVCKKGRSAIACFEDGKRAMDFFKKYNGEIIQKLNVNNMNDFREEKEALECLEISSNEQKGINE